MAQFSAKNNSVLLGIEFDKVGTVSHGHLNLNEILKLGKTRLVWYVIQVQHADIHIGLADFQKSQNKPSNLNEHLLKETLALPNLLMFSL